MTKEFRRIRVGEPMLFAATAAGADMDEVFDRFELMRTNTKYLIENIYFTMTADANAANRTVTITIEDEIGRVVFSNAHATPITAGLVGNFNLGPEIQYRDWEAVGLSVCLPLSKIYIKEDYSIQITITNIQVGDIISEVIIFGDYYRGVILDE